MLGVGLDLLVATWPLCVVILVGVIEIRCSCTT